MHIVVLDIYWKNMIYVLLTKKLMDMSNSISSQEQLQTDALSQLPMEPLLHLVSISTRKIFCSFLKFSQLFSHKMWKHVVSHFHYIWFWQENNIYYILKKQGNNWKANIKEKIQLWFICFWNFSARISITTAIWFLAGSF